MNKKFSTLMAGLMLVPKSMRTESITYWAMVVILFP